MAAGALERLLAAPLEQILTSDSIPAAAHKRLRVLRTAPLRAHAVRQLLPRVSEHLVSHAEQ